VINGKDDVEVIVPSTRMIKRQEGYEVKPGATVVDIRGGGKLAGDSRDDPLSGIGEMLILHADGRVEVTNDFDDLFNFRMYTFADEHEAAAKQGAAPPAGGYGGGGYGGGAGGGY
jgi:hypothetical protein